MASVGFRWLDILEKEFDKAFVDLDLEIGELHCDEPELVYNVRQRLCTLSSCFAQLTHKAQTIFQNSAKIEAELIHMRAELVDSKAKREMLEKELHNLLLQLHTSQLSQLPNMTPNYKQDLILKPDVNNIKKKLEEELKKSPSHYMKCSKESDEIKFNPSLVEVTQLRTENSQLQMENAALRNSILALNSEAYGAKLAAKYLDKELAGRIQQLQLLGREMRGDLRDKLWRQLESEILLQRHKTVVRECRRNSLMNNNAEKACPKPDIPSISEQTQNFGDIRTVVVKRKPGQGLGISITGGREHGVPILISELEPNGPAYMSGQLYIGDAILSVNDRDLRQACHREAVDILKQQNEDCRLQVQYIAADDSDNSLDEDGFNFRYKFFDREVCDNNDCISLHPLHPSGVLNTPTAPRTPESSPDSGSRSIGYQTPIKSLGIAPDFSQIIVDIDQLTTDSSNNNNNVGAALIEIDNSNIQTYSINSSNTSLMLTEKQFKKSNDTTQESLVDSPQKTSLIINNNNANSTNLIDLNEFKKPHNHLVDDLNCSNNSLNSENLSSPMQTSTDVFLDSEILSTDLASNDSQSPKNLQNDKVVKKDSINLNENLNNNDLLEVKKFNEFCFSYDKPHMYASNETFSNTKSDESLLNTEDSCDTSPIHKHSREYKKLSKKHKSKKYFGVKTLQSIFSKHDGYSDISSTASDVGDELFIQKKIDLDDVQHTTRDGKLKEKPLKSDTINANTIATTYQYNDNAITDTSPQFEENIHNFLSEMFVKNFPNQESNVSSITVNKTIGTKKQFKLHGQNLRVGKALRLCPNNETTLPLDNEQRREKLLARYVYNANSIGADGVGDPDFGTPV